MRRWESERQSRRKLLKVRKAIAHQKNCNRPEVIEQTQS
ncbi:hypothetical protein COO91_10582 (plasmid) [Nostoc flagelliforme CCNUN1]|uniref:Uncharacterized protein n=1 Tax=Nostoc flagelliforme CCNUN1 TaxID=2038116 RepID=A0A2K8T9M7_9NOSO|nr:hypothetical protein COO91_10582 [Nostoc flagelliforme CCNUN1]